MAKSDAIRMKGPIALAGGRAFFVPAGFNRREIMSEQKSSMTPFRNMASKLSVIEGSEALFHVFSRDFIDSLSDAGRSMIESGCFLQFLVNHEPVQCIALMREVHAYMEMRQAIFAANHPDEWKELQEVDEELRLEAEGAAS